MGGAPQILLFVAGIAVVIGIVSLLTFVLVAILRSRDIRKCSACGYHKVDRSGPDGVRDTLAGWLGFIPYRCQGCKFRFYGLRSRMMPEGY